jgi:flagellar biosynthesis regulator FlaF
MERQHISSYLTEAIHDRAYELAEQQTSEEKILQVYVNTIAVLAANTYLGWLNFDTDLDGCESLSPVMATIGDYADLYLPKLGGTIECRLVDRNAKSVSLTPQAVADRLGCLVLQIDGNLEQIEEIEEVKIIGFTSNLAPEIELSSLQPLEEAIAYLEGVEAQVQQEIAEVEATNSVSNRYTAFIERIIALRPQLSSYREEILTAIETKFNREYWGEFVNDLEQYIINELLNIQGKHYAPKLKLDRLATQKNIELQQLKNDATGNLVPEEEFETQLRAILKEIRDEKRKEAASN